jgi:hypothetical protein
MKGGLSGCTIWNNVSKETFERFVQFAYTGDYSIPETEKRTRVVKPEKAGSDVLAFRPWLGSELNEPSAIEEADSVSHKEYTIEHVAVKNDDIWGSWGVTKKVESEKSYFQSLSFPVLAPRNSYSDTCEPAGFEPDQSYSKVLLAHASLYVLGDYWLIDSLKSLALYKLHKTLCILKLDNENIEDIVNLARYAYSGEAEGSKGGIGELRSLVCRYMAANAAGLSFDAGFMDLLGEGGQFVKDFFKSKL